MSIRNVRQAFDHALASGQLDLAEAKSIVSATGAIFTQAEREELRSGWFRALEAQAAGSLRLSSAARDQLSGRINQPVERRSEVFARATAAVTFASLFIPIEKGGEALGAPGAALGAVLGAALLPIAAVAGSVIGTIAALRD